MIKKMLASLVFALPVLPAIAQAPELQRSNRHALIIGVGQYADARISPLLGVVHDVANARLIAEQMGVPAKNMHVLQDREASSAQIRSALRELASRIHDGDRVFVYYSGHGARFSAADEPDVCREALVPWDAEVSSPKTLLSQDDIAAEMAAVYAKADKVFVFIDACHSGGVRATTRSTAAGTKEDQLVPKFTPLGASGQCRLASNVRTRSVQGAARTRGAPGRNLVQFSSSRPDQVSLDSPQTGGLATSSWRYCTTYAEDIDRSGALSVNEIAACVQRRIDERLANSTRYSGQNVVVSGNGEFAPSLTQISQAPSLPPSEAVALGSAQTASNSSAPLQTVSPQGPSIAVAPARPVPLQLQKPVRFPLESVIAQSDERHIVSVEFPRTPLRIGRDFFDLTVSSNRGGYVYLILQSSDNATSTVLFPNAIDQRNQILAGERMKLPRPSWRIQSQGPAGTNRLLVMVTDAPRDLSLLRASPEGPFVKTLSGGTAAQSLAWVIGSAKESSSNKCSAQFASKDLQFVEECSDSFGAAVIEIREQ